MIGIKKKWYDMEGEKRSLKIVLKDITKHYGKDFQIEHLNMTIKSKKFTTLLGPSGCGKTTILRMIAGLETPDEGEIWLGDTCVYSKEKQVNVPPEKRNLGFVFQDFALWPHMTVFENVAFPLRARKKKDHIKETVMDALRTVRLEKLAERYPSQMSGGQQQRVAFARAIAGNVDGILFDEPLSALDAILREEMRGEIKKISQELGTTSIFVTHDQVEAMSLSDEIFVLNQGRIEQYGSPQEIYDHPASKFVAGFIGKSNWIENNAMFRPEAASLEPVPGADVYETTVIEQQFLGNMYEVQLDMNGNHWVIYTPKKQMEKNLAIYINKEKIRAFLQESIA